MLLVSTAASFIANYDIMWFIDLLSLRWHISVIHVCANTICYNKQTNTFVCCVLIKYLSEQLRHQNLSHSAFQAELWKVSQVFYTEIQFYPTSSYTIHNIIAPKEIILGKTVFGQLVKKSVVFAELGSKLFTSFTTGHILNQL